MILAILARILPITSLFGLICLEFLILFLIIDRREENQIHLDKSILLWTGFLLGFFVLLSIFMIFTGLGLSPDRTGWDNPGVPLHVYQVSFAVFLVLILTIIMGTVLRKWVSNRVNKIDLVIMFIIWISAAVLWISEPLTPTYFSPTPRLPNNEYYPFSDAALLDVNAENILIGEGFARIAEKPIYNIFLAGLHLIAGHDYLKTVNLQILVLALFPVLVYILGSALNNRTGGTLAAILLILRERNAIALSGEIDVSNSKMMMTDFPAALGLTFLTLFVFIWINGSRNQKRWAMVCGGTMGSILLLRSQAIILIPVLILFLFIFRYKNLKSFSAEAGLFIAGVVLVILPWMVRNYIQTGVFGYTQPFQTSYITKQYSFTPELSETFDGDITQLGFDYVVAFSMENPGYVVKFIFTHFLHNEVSTLLALPSEFTLSNDIVNYYVLNPYWDNKQSLLKSCCSYESWVEHAPFWNNWKGVIPGYSILPISFSLCLISIGIAAAWKRWNWVGFLPLAIHLTYSLSTAIARVSGWRLILPADWVGILYYALGLGTVIFWGLSLLVPRIDWKSNNLLIVVEERNVHVNSLPGWKGIFWLSGLLLVIGLVVPMTEVVVPSKYTNLEKEAGWELVFGSEQTKQLTEDYEQFVSSDYSAVYQGRALYPRFYPAGEGEPSTKWPAFAPHSFAQLGFYLVGPSNVQVVLPLGESPEVFPHASDVTALGCWGEDGRNFTAWAVYLQNEGILLMGDQSLSVLCSVE
ncbi:MAG: hypothetical protein JXA19_06960 [Anaerolineales bacterium]|nr:hypothetical protein [Anaerolineales bacterium]